MAFEEDGFKEVRRQSLDSLNSSRSNATPNASVEAQHQQRLNIAFGRLIYQENDPEILTPTGDVFANPTDTGAEDAYEFRLFAQQPKADNLADQSRAVQRIALRSPSPINHEPGFLVPHRPDTFYFTGNLDSICAAQFEEVAVTGEEVLSQAKSRWPGSSVLWKVMIISSKNAPEESSSHAASESTDKRCRKRSGKKRRIAIRKKLQDAAMKRLIQEQSRAEKDAADKEKRTRRNREKKVKRKEKEKLKKSGEARSHG